MPSCQVSPLQFILQRLALQESLQVQRHDLEGPSLLMTRLPRHMRRNKAILGLPKRVITRQRLRVGNIERRATDLARLEGVHERRLVDDRAAGNIHKKGLFARTQNIKLFLPDETLGVFCQGQTEHEHVETLGEKGVEVGLGGAVGPGGGEDALGVAEALDVEGAVTAGLGGLARGRGVGVDGHAHGFADAGDLAAYGAVADDASVDGTRVT